jgi:hypothetical protein
MRAKRWLLAAGLGLALAAPAPAQPAMTWGNPVTAIQSRVVNTKKALFIGSNSNIPIAAPYVLQPQATRLSLTSFLPTSVGRITAKPTHGVTTYPTHGQMPTFKSLIQPFQIRTGSP